ncbi:MAG TPA: hypothetical protein VF128_04665 [Gemmatimonadaceae bacterium]
MRRIPGGVVNRRAALMTALLFLAAPAFALAQGIPPRLSDQEFWRLVTESSEADGFFQSDNLVSNELTLQHIIPELVKGRAPGGVYLGVGPDQNFTYIAAMRPRVAFIVDIRRGAMLQHLMYKSLFEMAEDRAEFLSLLFSRPRPAGVSADATPIQLLEAFYPVATDSTLYWRTLKGFEDRLVKQHAFVLSKDDLEGIAFVFTSFFLGGPDISYNYGQGFGRQRNMPSFADLMVATDTEGLNRGFLGNEQQYAVIRQMHLRNLIVPVIGDFAGPKAVRAVGEYLRAHGAVVSAIYTSNVEQYLFRVEHNWRRYYENVATLPIDSSSTFVRAVFNNFGYLGGGTGPRSITMLQPVLDLLKAFREGRITAYLDVVNMSRTVW